MRDGAQEHHALLPSDPLRTRDARRWLSELLVAEGFSPVDARALEVAFSEACSNLHRHAYLGRRDGRIGLQVRVDREGAIVTLEHDGEAFDPSRYRAPDLGQPEEHGYGLYLIRSLVDEVRFERMHSGGRVTLIKRRRPEERRLSMSIPGGGHVRS